MFPGYNAHLEEMHATEEDFKFGAVTKLPQEVLCPDRNWEAPKFEPQSNAIFDTFSCTNFAICNIIEMMHKKRYGEEINLSDRLNAIVTGTVPGQGNSHKNVAEKSRKAGFVAEEMYPFTALMTQAEYFTEAPKAVLGVGLQWVVKTEFGYEKVERKDFWDVLTLSPIHIAVDSRTSKTSEFKSWDHSITIREGIYNQKLFTTDNYLGRSLEYDWDYPFGFPQRYHYKRIESLIVKEEDLKNNYIANFIQWLRRNGVIVKVQYV